MLVNFTGEEIVTSKTTVVGVAEKISPTLVAAINDGASPVVKRSYSTRSEVNKAADEAKFRDYLKGVLGHLPEHEKAMKGPVLRNYAHVFHMNEDSQFQSTDLVEHRLITGDTKHTLTWFPLPCGMKWEPRSRT